MSTFGATLLLYDTTLRQDFIQKTFFYQKGKTFMGKQLNPLEKELLIRRYKGNPCVKLSDFCTANGVSDTAFKKWLRQYDESGLEGLYRASSNQADLFPAGIDRTEESYKREIIRLRIEVERLKKNYTVTYNADGGKEFVPLSPKSSE